MGRGYGGTVLWGTRYKMEKITGLISQQGEASNRTVNDCGGIIWRDAGVKRELAETARATRPPGLSGSISRPPSCPSRKSERRQENASHNYPSRNGYDSLRPTERA